MAKKGKLITDLGDRNDGEFSDDTTKICNNLEANIGSFPGLPKDDTILRPQIDAYNKCRLAVAFPTQVAETADFRMAVQKTITEDGNWLNAFCDGNLVLLQKTGYPFVKDAEAQGKLPETTMTLNTVPNSALIEFYITHIKGSNIHYGIMVTTADNLETDESLWTYYYAAQREGAVPKLKRNTAYKMVSFAMGTSNELTYSEVVNITTL